MNTYLDSRIIILNSAHGRLLNGTYKSDMAFEFNGIWIYNLIWHLISDAIMNLEKGLEIPDCWKEFNSHIRKIFFKKVPANK